MHSYMLPLQKDWFYRLVQGVMELGSAPGPTRATIGLIPVDFLAQNICHISHKCVAEQGNKVYVISTSFTNHL